MKRIKDNAIRTIGTKSEPLKEVVIALPYTAPLDWQSLLSVFRSHQITPIETISDTIYERLFRIDGALGVVRVMHVESESQLLAHIFTRHATTVDIVEKKIRKMFDLDARVSEFEARFMRHSLFDVLWKRHPGQRLASGWDAFETSVNTILGQLVSVKRANDLMKQLIELHGEKITHPLTGEKSCLFPSPKTLAAADLTALGTTKIRKKTIKEFSRLVAEKKLDLTKSNIEELKEELLEVPGIGPWSVEYIALRALGDADSFPATDLGIKRALEKYPRMNVEKLRPYRSYAAVCLWKNYMELKSKQKGKQS